jgi:hypothetical protein
MIKSLPRIFDVIATLATSRKIPAMPQMIPGFKGHHDASEVAWPTNPDESAP